MGICVNGDKLGSVMVGIKHDLSLYRSAWIARNYDDALLYHGKVLAEVSLLEHLGLMSFDDYMGYYDEFDAIRDAVRAGDNT